MEYVRICICKVNQLGGIDEYNTPNKCNLLLFLLSWPVFIIFWLAFFCLTKYSHKSNNTWGLTSVYVHNNIIALKKDS